MFHHELPRPLTRPITASLKPDPNAAVPKLLMEVAVSRARHSFAARLAQPLLRTHCLLFLPGSGTRWLPRMTLAADVAGAQKK